MYEEIIKNTKDEEEILRQLFSTANEKTFGRIMTIILQNRFLKKFLDKLYYFQPIEKTDTKANELDHREEKLVALNKYDTQYDGIIQLHPKLFISPELYLSDKEGSIPIVFVRESVVDFLLKALEELPTGYAFNIYEGFRTIECQKYLYNEILLKKVEEENERIENYSNSFEDIATNLKENIMPEYVSDPDYLFPHNTGGAIDIRICDSNGVPLNYGYRYNEYETTANLNYYERKMKNGDILDDIQIEALITRRVTCNILKKVIEDNNYDFISVEDCHLDINNQGNNGISTKVYGSCEHDDIFLSPDYTIVEYMNEKM